MPTAWLRHRCTLGLFLFLPGFPALPLSPPEAKPAVVVEAGAASALRTAAPAPEEPLVLPGVVIEKIPKDSALQKAGLQVGDVILSWERLPNPPTNPAAARGRIEGPFDWMWLEIEQAPRGLLKLSGEREGAQFSCEVAAEHWGVAVTPNFVGQPANRFRRGRLLESGGEISSAVAEWRSLAIWLGQRAYSSEEAWLNSVLARVFAARGNRVEAKAHYLRAVDKASSGLVKILTLELVAQFLVENGESSEAERYFRIVLALRADRNFGELGLARDMSNIAVALRRQGKNSEIGGFLFAAHEMYDRIAPQTLAHIEITRNLGLHFEQLGDLDQSIRYLQKAVAMAQTVWPNSTVHANSLQALGDTEMHSGRMQEARSHLSLALELFERLEPGSTQLANTLNTLSLYYKTQGDLDQALVLARRSVSISERKPGTEIYTAVALNSIALIEIALGQWSDAESDLAKGLDLASMSEQAKEYVPALLNNMGLVQENQGKLSAALSSYRRSLDLKRKNSKLDIKVAFTLKSLGILQFHAGHCGQARRYLAEALSIQRHIQPSSADTARAYGDLASVLVKCGNPVTARKYFERALKIIDAGAPSSPTAAQIYSNYGLWQERLGFYDRAREYSERAVALSDTLFLHASSSHTALTSFAALNSSAYVNAMEVYEALAEHERAFEMAERMRGRSLMVQLAERDLLSLSQISDQVAGKMKDVERLLEKESVDDGEPTGKSRSRAEERASLFRERDDLIAQIRRTSPQLANVRYPLALNFDEIRSTLDPGTTLLSFALGSPESALFVVGRYGDLHVHSLRISEADLRQRIERFRNLNAQTRPGTELGEMRALELRRLSKELYKLLIAPVADYIEKADRVLILADGALHYLPFAALVRELPAKDGPSRDQYLAEWKPLHSVLSMNLYAEIKKARRDLAEAKAGRPLLFTGFGDPRISLDIEEMKTDQKVDFHIRSAMRRGVLQLQALPFSRREIEGIAELFPPDQVAIFLGDEATEERAKAIGKNSRILHFATHARLDDRFPLDSALVLTMPEGLQEDRDNGLLQVWEIFGKVRLDADLVVLSGCETALGKEQGGEGLIGLTRAFQYAGARTVMASLWSVRDQATSELMIRFYKHLRSGLSKDEALRRAQIELIRSPIEVVDEKGEKTLLDARAPYFWAGFQVYGDWQ